MEYNEVNQYIFNELNKSKLCNMPVYITVNRLIKQLSYYEDLPLFQSLIFVINELQSDDNEYYKELMNELVLFCKINLTTILQQELTDSLFVNGTRTLIAINYFRINENAIRDMTTIDELTNILNEVVIFITNFQITENTVLTSSHNLNHSKLSVNLPDNEVCTICHECFMKDNTIITLTCNHIFHTNCIEKWLFERSSTCPLCRTNVL